MGCADAEEFWKTPLLKSCAVGYMTCGSEYGISGNVNWASDQLLLVSGPAEYGGVWSGNTAYCGGAERGSTVACKCAGYNSGLSGVEGGDAVLKLVYCPLK